MIYMLHNKTSQTKVVYIDLNVTFIHGTMQELNALGGRPYHDLHGVLFGRTYDVPRQSAAATASGRRRRTTRTAPSSGRPRKTARSSARAGICTRAACA